MTNRFYKKASALVTTLLVLVVLSTVVVAFMASMGLEKKIAQSSKNKYQADLVAEAGKSSFISKITALMTDRPLHAIGYTNQGGAGGVPHPVLLGARTYSGEIPETFLLNSSEQLLNTLPTFTSANSVNVNKTNSATGARGWIGSPISKIGGNWTQTTPTNSAIWVNILEKPTLPNQPDPSQPNYNPVIGRYAYWVEDETAKINLRLAGNNDGPDGAFSRNASASTNASQLDIGAVPLDRQSNPNRPLPMVDPATMLDSGAPANNAVIEFMSDKEDFPVAYRLLTFNDAAPVQGIDEEDIKFHITYDSVSNELAGTGRRRANLNHIVTDSLEPDKIAADLADIIYVITGQHIFRGREYHDEISNAAHDGVFLDEDDQAIDTRAMPDFGRRFYTTPAIATGANLKDDHTKTYLLKLAANIRDYMDSDSQPTYVDFSGEVKSGGPIRDSWLSGEEPIALGKEAIPYFQEHVWRGGFVSMAIVAGTTRRITFTMDHYFEFYNPSTKDWIAPAGSFLLVKNLPDMDAGTLPWVELPDFEMDLSGLLIPAGNAVIITTCPVGEDPPGLIPPGALVFRGSVPVSARRFVDVLGNVGVAGSRRGLRLRGRSSPSYATDYESELIFGTSLGILGAFPALTLAGTGSPFEMTLTADGTGGTWATLTPAQHNTRFTWAHSLRGNDRVSRSGDPRSLTEMMDFVAGTDAAYGSDQARFFNNFNGNNDINETLPGQYASGNPKISLGNPANLEYVNPVNWPDYHPQLSNSAAKAYAVISDAAMKSIGELGHIYDPHRKIAPANPRDSTDADFTTPPETTRIKRARGGGRTLKIGQPDDLVANTRFSGATAANISWFNGAWRLTDLFSADAADKPESEPTSEGKININGVLRDNGTAFRAALRNLFFQPSPEGDPARQNRLLNEDEIDQLISQIISYLQTNGPMLCRGELGQIPFFSAPGVAGIAGGHPSSTAMDRSREEIFRRIVETITTKSLTFKIYVIGEAVRQNPDGSIVVTATSLQQATIHLEPDIKEMVNSQVTGYKAKIDVNISL